MDNVTIVVKAKQVGNSIALFVPAEICNSLGIKANSDVVAQIQKKKNKDVKKLDSLFGALKGKHVSWSCKEDRLDVWGI
jgi:antitoxin component of MazEF toxin-antitoxin module